MPDSAFAGSPALLANPRARVSQAERDEFRECHAFWIEGWEKFAGEGAIADQVRFEREWTALREYARERGVGLIGDLPIYVAPDRADQRAHPDLFLPGVVAGAPPDALSALGQLWQNPVYDWPAHRRQRYRWWTERFRRAVELFDLARIDHFRGFVSFWEIPAGARDARPGHWHRGPGAAVFRAAEKTLGPLPLIVEDLGVITPAVRRLRDELGYPGMLVLQFGFEGGAANPHRPANHREPYVVYTGTHDMDTAVGWWRSLPERQRRETGFDPVEPNWSMIRLALGSKARLSIVPAQDVLGLGSEGRMNRPGTVEGNWRWRLAPGQLTPVLAGRLRRESEAAGRAPSSAPR